MKSYKLSIQFDGSTWFGWQSQNDFEAVQEQVENALNTLYNCSAIKIDGSGRTDAGVHAFGLCASFTEPKESKFTSDTLRKGMNALLPISIRIRSAIVCSPDFHARFSCVGKTYVYFIDNSTTGSPILAPYSWHMRKKLNKEKMRQSLKYLEGKHDFSAFTVDRKNLQGHAVRTVFKAELIEIGHIVALLFTGDGFLYRMVRSMAGEVVNVGMEFQEPQHTLNALESHKRSKAGVTAPAEGLFLGQCYYSQEEMETSLNKDAKDFCLKLLFNFDETV
ncbi:tRNA pseudouridine(38-40) synthase TruA [Lentisphaera marina]|uniref:tRNA pseudouridine(38-40) synthase TruA n=1 Tax=Lentisphaera marina TaxID=1111041 RepID=UPI0023665590|nr:tRNA pseudouridine(38-40) synthase TruA [Lentisphaera marina]MDD7984233.1 tRNA pseudouridine(38-40) synthase TruA [Lentisphaera marina]